jgi:hypothetical protein
MGFDWGDESYRYRVQVLTLPDGRYTWRLVTAGHRDGQAAESVEDCPESFDSGDAAEEAGRRRMAELARDEKPG